MAKPELHALFNPLNILSILNKFVDNLLNLRRAKKILVRLLSSEYGKAISMESPIQTINLLFKKPIPPPQILVLNLYFHQRKEHLKTTYLFQTKYL